VVQDRGCSLVMRLQPNRVQLATLPEECPFFTRYRHARDARREPAALPCHRLERYGVEGVDSVSGGEVSREDCGFDAPRRPAIPRRYFASVEGVYTFGCHDSNDSESVCVQQKPSGGGGRRGVYCMGGVHKTAFRVSQKERVPLERYPENRRQFKPVTGKKGTRD